MTSRIRQGLKTSYDLVMQLFNGPSAPKKYDLSDPMTADLIRNKGERATHLHPNDNYIAHLSVYDYATRYCQGATVLDAGSGAGYGSAFLAEHGAERVVGVELDQDAVQFSRQVFGRIPNLDYRQMSLEKIQGFEENEFDVIFSSNVIEHVPDVHAFFSKAAQILKPSGKMILAVPEIQDDLGKVIANLNNPYHVNIWTMKQWQHTLEQYFQEVTPCYHYVIGNRPFNSVNKPEESDYTLANFRVIESTEPGQNALLLTAVFLAEQPKKQPGMIDRGIIDHSFNVNLPGPVNFDLRGRLRSDILYSSQTHVGRLKTGIRLSQSFICNRDRLAGIALSIGTFRRQIDSLLRLALLDDRSNLLREVQVNTLEIPDNSFYPFLFDPVADSKGRLFTFSIETIADQGDAVTFWTNNRISNVCTRNGAPVNYGLLYKCCFR